MERQPPSISTAVVGVYGKASLTYVLIVVNLHKVLNLGSNEKVKNWFCNEAMCKKMLSHWQGKDHWLGRTLSWAVKNEIWDG